MEKKRYVSYLEQQKQKERMKQQLLEFLFEELEDRNDSRDT